MSVRVASPRHAPYTPRRCEGVGRHESPQHLKNIDWCHNRIIWWVQRTMH